MRHSSACVRARCAGAVAALLAVALPAGAAGEAEPPRYHVVAQYPVGGTDLGYDYLQVDSGSRRLFLTHGTHIEVLDADTGARLGQVSDLAGAHGVEIVDRVHMAFATSGIDRTVRMFDPQTLQVVKTITHLGEKPDALKYDPNTGLLFVVNGGATGDVSVIDPAAGAVVDTIKLGGGKLEEIAVDGAGRGFVNDEDKNVVHVFDTRSRKSVGSWPVHPGEGPTGLAIDVEHHRLFAACGNRLLVILDSNSGKLLGTAPIGDDPDGAVFDHKSGLVFASNRDGTLSVVSESTPGNYHVQTVATGPGARTIALDAKTGRLFLPTGRFGPPPAPAAAGATPRAQLIPESLAILVVSP